MDAWEADEIRHILEQLEIRQEFSHSRNRERQIDLLKSVLALEEFPEVVEHS